MTRAAALILCLALLALVPAGAAAKPAPDLTVSALAPAHTAATAGSPFRVAVRTLNRGARKTRRSTTGIYLSKDARRSRGDIQLGSQSVRALKRHKSARTVVASKLAMFIPGGKYRVLACADDTRRVKESNERNNCVVAKRTVTITSSGPIQPTRITVAATGSGTGTISSAPAAINCGDTCTGVFAPGTHVTLTATPAAGSRFAGWTGGCSSSDATCAPSGDTQAAFVKRVGAAAASTAGGTAGVSSADPAATCSATACQVDLGQDVVYTATPDPGWRFASWIGDCAGGGATVTLTGATTDTSCVASFSRSFRVTWAASPAAGGTIVGGIASGSGTCDAAGCNVDPGSSVQITRTTADGYRFLQWNSDCADNVLNGQITLANIQADHDCSASFVAQHTITWTVKSAGAATPTAGTVTKGTTTGFVVCQASSCVGDASGSTPGGISLTASPNQGYRFAGWSCTGDATDPLPLNFSIDRTCDANFVRQYTVQFATSPADQGSVIGQILTGFGSCGTVSCTVDSGGEVQLTATDSPGYVFNQWSGDCNDPASSTNSQYRLTDLQANKSCTAGFVATP